jgi:hypothetical protein
VLAAALLLTAVAMAVLLGVIWNSPERLYYALP